MPLLFVHERRRKQDRWVQKVLINQQEATEAMVQKVQFHPKIDLLYGVGLSSHLTTLSPTHEGGCSTGPADEVLHPLVSGRKWGGLEATAAGPERHQSNPQARYGRT